MNTTNINSFATPILFIVFNRPDTTARVFAQIRKMKPRQLFVAADGHRESRPGEKEVCEQTRRVVLDNIDWECEVKTLLREENLGCRKAVKGAIDWFFNHVEQGIILEDDCLPDDSFFGYSEDLLNRYQTDTRIMTISGYNGLENFQCDSSYFFSKYVAVWGWATWKRAWEKYIDDYALFSIITKTDFFISVFQDDIQRNHRIKVTDETYKGCIDSWAYLWSFSVIANNGLTVIPSKNLVTNIGLDNSGTHHHFADKVNYAMQVYQASLPLVHPFAIYANKKYEDTLFYRYNPHYVKKKYTFFMRLKDSIKYRSRNIFQL